MFKVYLKYTRNSSTLTQSNILQYIFSWTSTQLKCIKYKISLQGILIKQINTMQKWFSSLVFLSCFLV